jgi:hypothetical protein
LSRTTATPNLRIHHLLFIREEEKGRSVEFFLLFSSKQQNIIHQEDL